MPRIDERSLANEPSQVPAGSGLRYWRNRKLTTAFAAALVAMSSGAQADCLQVIEGSMLAVFRITACRSVDAPKPDGRPLLRLSVAELGVHVLPGPGDDDEVLSPYRKHAALLERSQYLFVEARQGVDCKTLTRGEVHVAAVDARCCDTLPHRGVCALPGPLVSLQADGSYEDPDLIALLKAARGESVHCWKREEAMDGPICHHPGYEAPLRACLIDARIENWPPQSLKRAPGEVQACMEENGWHQPSLEVTSSD